MHVNCILRPVESWNHSIRNSAQGIQKSSQGESQDHTRGGGGDIEMEFNIRPSTTKNPAANGDERTGYRHAGTGLPPPLLLCRAVQRWAPSTVPACLDPAADLDRPASNSETATCLSDGGLQPTSRKTLISFSPRLTRQNRGIRMAFGLRIIKIRPSLENERLEFHAACITRQGVAVRMQQVQVGPVVPFLGAVDYGSPSHRHLARILADQRVGGNGTH